jgi:AmmeMemoRadiSam system protein B
MSGVREATHAGSWYTDNGSRLRAELEGYLSKVTPIPSLAFTPPVQDAKAIIAPHAGYSYSGPAAAWAYASIPTDKIKRVFLLGPSHHVYLSGIALSGFAAYGTPLGDLPLDLETIAELRRTKLFSEMKPSVDEDEHSLEMHLPYIRQVFGSSDVKLVPLLVGHPPASQTEAISAALAKYWDDPATFFIISSDFCHWGTRFSCTPYYPQAPDPPNPVPPVEGRSAPTSSPPEMVKRFANPGPTPIWKSIQYMDHEGMDLLRKPALKGAVDAWESYLGRTKNTICGRNPITVLLNLVQYRYGGKAGAEDVHFNFVRYEQSSRCKTGRDSSVSYVSGVLRPSA